jgi:hypothetical protein
MFKFLPQEAKRYLLGIFNEMMSTGMIPESWLRTKNFHIQYGFRKGRGTRDCLALLTTDVHTFFERKQQTVAAFIDISSAYDNVLIDILCNILREKEVPLHVVRFLFRLLWRKVLVFFVGGIV